MNTNPNMNKFVQIAQDTLSLSKLMSARQQITTEEIIGEELTIINFDFATITDKGEEKTFPVILFAEHPECYYNGGALLSKLCTAWAAEFDGDIEAASDALEDAGGVRVKFRSTKTKTGNNLTSVDLI